MFGANSFGTPSFGEEFVESSIPLDAVSTISFSTSSFLGVPANLTSDSTMVAFSTSTSLTTRPVFNADTTISVSTDSFLSLFGYLEGNSTFAFGSDAALFIEQPLACDSTIAFSTATPNLTIGAITFANDTSSISVSSTAFLNVQPQLLASSTIPFSTIANLTDTGVSSFTTQFTINGVHVEDRVRFDTVTINDVLNEEPNTLTFTINGAAPVIGSDVKVGLLNLAVANLVFGGTIIDVQETYDSSIGNIAWVVDCRDYSYLLNRRAIWKRYDKVSATTIVLDLMTHYSQGFTTINVAGGLPAITIALSGSNLSDALTQIDTLAGTYHYVDYGRDLHVFVTEATNAPDSISTTNTATLIDPALALTSTTDQVRNRVFVQGHSSSISSPGGFAIPSNVTVLPLDDVSTFSAGQAFIEPSNQIVSYTGKSAGGTTAVVVASAAAGATPPAPGVSLVSGTAGHISGSHIWKIAFGNNTGESVLGDPSTNLACPDISQPTLAPGIGITGTAGPLVGTYKYAITNVTTLGETQIGPFSTRTAAPLVAIGPPTVGTVAGPGNLVVGSTYGYKTTLVDQFGETAMSANSFLYTPEALQKPSLSVAAGVTFGNLIGSSYTYGVSLVTQFGEANQPALLTVNGPFNTLAPGGNIFWSGTQDTAGRVQPGLTYVWSFTAYNLQFGETALGIAFSLAVGGGVPVRLLMTTPFNFSDPNIDGFRAYRAISGNPFFLEFDFRRGNIQNNGQYFSVANQNELINPYPVSQQPAGQKLNLNVFPSAELGVVARRIYRSKAGATDLYFVGEIQNNFTTQFLDNIPDSQLTTRNPVIQTTGRQAQLTNIATSTNPGIIGRRVYRTKAGGSAYYPVADIRDNITTFIVDNLADSSLGGSTGPGTSTAGGDQHLLTSIQIGAPGTLARRIYRTVANGAEFKFLAQLSDNVTTTYIDNLPDTSLGASAPLVSTAGSSAVAVTVPIGSSGITQRIIYRTPANNTTDFKYVGTVNDNSTTSFIDTLADTDLGRLPPPSATIGVLPGDLTISLSPSASGFTIPGWAIADSQLIYYTGISGNTLTGIPPLTKVVSITRSAAVATMTTLTNHSFITNQNIVVFGSFNQEYNGSHTVTVTGPTTCTFPIDILAPAVATGTMTTSAPGAIVGSMSGGTSIVAAAELTGVSGLTSPVNPGDSVSLWITCNDLSSQAFMAASEGGDGIHEFLIVDDTLLDVISCTNRGNAELTLFSLPLVTLTYATRDAKTRSGKTIAVNLPPPLNIVTSLKILDVTIDQFNLTRTFPRFRVNKASNTKFSIADLIRHVVLN